MKKEWSSQKNVHFSGLARVFLRVVRGRSVLDYGFFVAILLNHQTMKIWLFIVEIIHSLSTKDIRLVNTHNVVLPYFSKVEEHN